MVELVLRRLGIPCKATASVETKGSSDSGRLISSDTEKRRLRDTQESNFSLHFLFHKLQRSKIVSLNDYLFACLW